MNTRLIGQIGEAIAVEYLKKNKFKILEQNYSTRLGEIDVIAKYHGVVCFIEVKYRLSNKYGLPRESITPEKIEHIKRTSELYISSHNLFNKKIEFDVLEVDDEGCNLIREAF